MGWAMALSGQAAWRRQCLQQRSHLGREGRKTVWAREWQGCQHHWGHPLPFLSTVPLTSSQNHCMRSPGGGKVRKGILTSRSVGGCHVVKFKASQLWGLSGSLNYAGFSLSVYLFLALLQGVNVIIYDIALGGTQASRRNQSPFPFWIPPSSLPGASPGSPGQRGGSSSTGCEGQSPQLSAGVADKNSSIMRRLASQEGLFAFKTRNKQKLTLTPDGELPEGIESSVLNSGEGSRNDQLMGPS